MGAVVPHEALECACLLDCGVLLLQIAENLQERWMESGCQKVADIDLENNDRKK